jgi:hypothetical protein
MQKVKVTVALMAFGGLMWAFCPWFVDLRGAVGDDNCACEVCLDECEHMNGDVCACSDNDCGCPTCVGVDLKDDNCACEVCIEGCEHMNGDVCDCRDNDCGCPACVGSD